MIQSQVHRAIIAHRDAVCDWFTSRSMGIPVPFYASFDIRHSQHKIVTVDANLFPGGFNNICQVDKAGAGALAREYFEKHYPNQGRRVLLLAEEHTKNAFYWENVHTLKTILEEAGAEVVVSIPQPLEAPVQRESVSGAGVVLHPLETRDGQVLSRGEAFDLILCNNDFSLAPDERLQGWRTTINPPLSMGWHRRRKNWFFEHYNAYATELAGILGLDPWHLTIRTEVFNDFDVESVASREQLAEAVDRVLEQMRIDYSRHKIPDLPVVFVKNVSGTYGLGIETVRDGQDVKNWSYRSRKRMKAAKGGREVESLIIQEGVPTALVVEEATAEPVIYMIGCSLAGGFLRTHTTKGPLENLNSPGAVYQRLCVSDLQINEAGCPLENVYGWVAKLSMLTIAKEIATNQR